MLLERDNLSLFYFLLKIIHNWQNHLDIFILKLNHFWVTVIANPNIDPTFHSNYKMFCIIKLAARGPFCGLRLSAVWSKGNAQSKAEN